MYLYIAAESANIYELDLTSMGVWVEKPIIPT